MLTSTKRKGRGNISSNVTTSFPQPQHCCCCIQTALKSKRWARLQANDTLLSGSEDASDGLFDMVLFKGTDSNFWLSFAKKRLVELFERQETESSSFDHEATNSNTSLLVKSKSLHASFVSQLSMVSGRKTLFTLQFTQDFRGVWRYQ